MKCLYTLCTSRNNNNKKMVIQNNKKDINRKSIHFYAHWISVYELVADSNKLTYLLLFYFC